jgi:large subunit ribosomal protein L10
LRDQRQRARFKKPLKFGISAKLEAFGGVKLPAEVIFVSLCVRVKRFFYDFSYNFDRNFSEKGGENMPNNKARIQQKQVIVNQLKEKLNKSVSAVLVDERGLTVLEATKLRKLFREAGVEYKVYKNTIMRHAFMDTPFAALDGYLAGPNALALCYDDSTKAARIIGENLRVMKALEFKAGFVEGRAYDAAGVSALSALPGKPVLLARALGSFKSPIAKFARLIKAISDKKAENQ